MPRRPSIEASSAVSSPQTNAPAPSFTDKFEAEVGPHHALAQQAALPAALEGLVDPLDGQRILGADVEEALVGPDRVGGDAHPFDDAVGERFQQHAVHERAGIALVAVADDVLHVARRRRGPSPTSSRWESRPRRGRAARSA